MCVVWQRKAEREVRELDREWAGCLRKRERVGGGRYVRCGSLAKVGPTHAR